MIILLLIQYHKYKLSLYSIYASGVYHILLVAGIVLYQEEYVFLNVILIPVLFFIDILPILVSENIHKNGTHDISLSKVILSVLCLSIHMTICFSWIMESIDWIKKFSSCETYHLNVAYPCETFEYILIIAKIVISFCNIILRLIYIALLSLHTFILVEELK